MDYLMTPPPANPSVEDLQRWMVTELQALEQVIAVLKQELDQMKGL